MLNNFYSLILGILLILSLSLSSQTSTPVSNLTITEIMYNPPESGNDSLEFIEIYNPDSVSVNMNGFTFSQGVSHTFSGITIAAHSFVVASVDSAAFRNVFGLPSIEWSSGGLSNGGEDIALRDNLGRQVDSVDYDDGSPWPSGGGNGQPDGGGSSIELISPILNNNDGSNWKPSIAGTGVFVNGLEVRASPGYFPINLSFTSNNVSCNGGNDGSATVTASLGTIPYTYAWSNGDTINSITSLAAGTYTVTVSDNSGNSTVGSVTITQPAILAPNVQIDSNVSCNGFSNGGATASATGGTAPYTYAWSNSATTASITGVSSGTYSITITDNNGCTGTSSGTITQPNTLQASTTATNISCFSSNDGSATASATGGTSPYTYSWSNAATTATISGLVSGSYTVTISDINGCSGSAVANISQPSLLTATSTSTNVTCNGGSDGTAATSASGGTSPYTYLWSNGSTSASNTGLTPGTYTVTVTDANGCTDNASVNITQPSAIGVNLITIPVSCNGGSDGSASATSSGGSAPYTFNWSNGGSGTSITNLPVGTYSLTVTDANGCASINSASITQPNALVITSTIMNVSCNGLADGSISLTAMGGSSPFTFNWSSGLPNTANQSNLFAGSYFVTITDANGCTITSIETVTEPSAIITTVSRVNVTLTSDQSGASYRWLDCNNGNTAISGETGQSFTATANGDYAVEVTLNGCVDTSACVNILSVGFKDNEFDQIQYSLYPNPSKGQLNVQVDGLQHFNERLRIFDMTGKIVKDLNVNSKQTLIDLSELSNGVYFIDFGGLRRKIVLSK